MLRLLLVSFLAVHCSCELISIGGADYGRTVLLSPHLNGVSSLGSYGLGSLGYTTYGGLGQYGTQSLYGLRPLGGIGLSSYVSRPASYHSSVISPVNHGFGLSAIGGLRPQSLNLVSAAQPVVARTVSGHDSVPVSAAIKQVGRTVEYRSVPNIEEPIVPQYVVVEPSDIPLHIHFKSRSSTIKLSQEHIPGEPGTVEQTRSEDEPSKIVHEVTKPVIQEVHEVIQPFRRVTQELQPVVESVHTVVSKGEGERRQYRDDGIRIAHRPTHQISRPFNTFQTVTQQFHPYQIFTQQPFSGHHTFVQPHGIYQTVSQPNIFTPTIGQAVYEQAINSFGRPISTSFGSSFGQSIGQGPIDVFRTSGDTRSYNPNFSREFRPDFAPGVTNNQRPASGEGTNFNRPLGERGNNEGPSPTAQPNEGSEDSRNSNTDSERSNDGSSRNENTDNQNNDSSDSGNNEE